MWQCGMFLRTVLTGLTLLSAHGAHRSWHRRPLWTVEPLLLEGQVRTVSRFLFAHSACLFTVIEWPAKCAHDSLHHKALAAQLVHVIKEEECAVKLKTGGSFSSPALRVSLCGFVWQCYCSLWSCVGMLTTDQTPESYSAISIFSSSRPCCILIYMFALH